MASFLPSWQRDGRCGGNTNNNNSSSRTEEELNKQTNKQVSNQSINQSPERERAATCFPVSPVPFRSVPGIASDDRAWLCPDSKRPQAIHPSSTYACWPMHHLATHTSSRSAQVASTHPSIHRCLVSRRHCRRRCFRRSPPWMVRRPVDIRITHPSAWRRPEVLLFIGSIQLSLRGPAMPSAHVCFLPRSVGRSIDRLINACPV